MESITTALFLLLINPLFAFPWMGVRAYPWVFAGLVLLLVALTVALQRRAGTRRVSHWAVLGLAAPVLYVGTFALGIASIVGELRSETACTERWISIRHLLDSDAPDGKFRQALSMAHAAPACPRTDTEFWRMFNMMRADVSLGAQDIVAAREALAQLEPGSAICTEVGMAKVRVEFEAHGLPYAARAMADWRTDPGLGQGACPQLQVLGPLLEHRCRANATACREALPQALVDTMARNGFHGAWVRRVSALMHADTQ